MFLMSQESNKKSYFRRIAAEEEEQTNSFFLFIECANLVLPWLSTSDLASISSTCKTLHQIAKTITTRRVSDASRGFEKHPIPFLNTIDNHSYSYFIYTPSQILGSPSPIFFGQPWGSSNPDKPTSNSSSVMMGFDPNQMFLFENSSGCDCKKKNNCCKVKDGKFDECPCVSMHSELLEMMTECGPSCGCGLECENRMTQRGLSIQLRIVKDGRKGWGLLAAQFIRNREFVCEYAGELLTTEEARKRQEKYDKLASAGGFSSALLVVREHLPSRQACLRVNIDATRIGNVARFINHSCDGGNLSTILVRSTGALLPRLCFFASRDIQEGEELTFSYGDVRIKPNGLPCFCGCPACFGVLPSEQT